MIELKLSRQSRHPILHCYSYFIDLYFSYCWTLWLKLSTLWQEFFCNPKLCQTYIVSWNSIFPPSKILPSSNFFPHCEIFLPKFGGNFPGGNIPPNSRSWNWPLASDTRWIIFHTCLLYNKLKRGQGWTNLNRVLRPLATDKNKQLFSVFGQSGRFPVLFCFSGHLLRRATDEQYFKNAVSMVNLMNSLWM